MQNSFPSFKLPDPLRVLFFGSDWFATQHLGVLATSPHIEHLEVVCPPDRSEHFLDTKKFALKRGLTVHQPPQNVNFRLEGWREPFSHSDFTVGVVVSFGYFVPDRIQKLFPLGMINVHPSLLPKYRGAAPIQHALLNDETMTGVSIIDLSTRLIDSGALLAQETHPIRPFDTYASLSSQLSKKGAGLLIRTLIDMQHSREERTRQPELENAIKARKVEKQHARLYLVRASAHEVRLKWRAFHGFLPLTFEWRNRRIILLELIIDEATLKEISIVKLKPYEMRYHATGKSRCMILLGCADSRVVAISRLQVATRNAMSAVDFANGYHLVKASSDCGLKPQPSKSIV